LAGEKVRFFLCKNAVGIYWTIVRIIKTKILGSHHFKKKKK